eukprot:6195295-Pleurochrysis_carterae.AAC.2
MHEKTLEECTGRLKTFSTTHEAALRMPQRNELRAGTAPPVPRTLLRDSTRAEPAAYEPSPTASAPAAAPILLLPPLTTMTALAPSTRWTERRSTLALKPSAPALVSAPADGTVRNRENN